MLAYFTLQFFGVAEMTFSTRRRYICKHAVR